MFPFGKHAWITPAPEQPQTLVINTGNTRHSRSAPGAGSAARVCDWGTVTGRRTRGAGNQPLGRRKSLSIRLSETRSGTLHFFSTVSHLENGKPALPHGVSPPQPASPPAAPAAPQAVLHGAPRLACRGDAAEAHSAQAALRGWLSSILTAVVSALRCGVAGGDSANTAEGFEKLPLPNREPPRGVRQQV